MVQKLSNMTRISPEDVECREAWGYAQRSADLANHNR